MENLKYVLEMENITKEFPGVKALDNVQLKLKDKLSFYILQNFLELLVK